MVGEWDWVEDIAYIAVFAQEFWRRKPPQFMRVVTIIKGEAKQSVPFADVMSNVERLRGGGGRR